MPPLQTTVFSPPDAQVKWQRIIQVELGDPRTSGRATTKTQAIGTVSGVSKAPLRENVPEAANPFEAQAQMINLRSAEEAKIEHTRNRKREAGSGSGSGGGGVG